MSTEPGTLVPLMKGTKQIALIVDHKQLPPVITSPEALELDIEHSLAGTVPLSLLLLSGLLLKHNIPMSCLLRLL
ncbi:hypothetical protein BC629DRAFT_1512640 [Irpex lacteus]|nr:hypothetical protein BC629DRAFT_1512640 [Irpex lacteus]